MSAKLRPWLPLVVLAAVAAAVAAFRACRPSAPPPAPGDGPADLAALQELLRRRMPDVTMAPCDLPGACLLCAGPTPRRPEDDLRLDVVLCEPAGEPGPAEDLGPSAFRAGAFRFSGDPPLIARLKTLFALPPPADALVLDPCVYSNRAYVLSDDDFCIPLACVAPACRDLTAMHPEQLAALDGWRVRFRVAVDSAVDRVGDRDCFEVQVSDPAAVGTVQLYAGWPIDDAMTVEGTLHVLHHPTRTVGGTRFAGFTEYRVADAVRVSGTGE